MQVSLTATGGLERRLEVAVPVARVNSEVSERLKKLSRTAHLKGFRPGKVPLPVIQQQFGEQVHTEVVGDLMRSTFAEAVNLEKLTPAAGPRIEPIAVQPGTDLKYAAVFEVVPEVKLKPVAGLKVEKPVAQVTDADVEAMIESMRRQLAAQQAEHAAHCENPEHDHGPAAAAAAPDAQLPLPALDDDFARAFGIAEGGLEKLRTEVRASMTREVEEVARNRLRGQVLEALYQDNPIELPRSQVEEQVQQMQLDAGRRMGAKDVSQLPPREPFEEPARRRVALGYLLSELVRSEQITADRERILARLNEMTAQYPNAEDVRRYYLQNAEAMRQVESAVLEDQAVERVLAAAQITEKPTSFAELTGFGQNK